VSAACEAFVGLGGVAAPVGAAASLGQGLRRGVGVAFTGSAAGVHPEEAGGGSHKLGKDTQHRIDPAIEGRWDYQSGCVGLRLCHEGSISRVQGVDEKVTPINLQSPGIAAEIFPFVNQTVWTGDKDAWRREAFAVSFRAEARSAADPEARGGVRERCNSTC